MDITISGRHVELSDELRHAVDEKIGSLSRFVEGMSHAEVVFKEEPHRRADDRDEVEVTLEGRGHHLRCKVTGPDPFAAVDRAVSKLEKQLRKLKTKLHRRHHPNPHRVRAEENGEQAFVAPTEPRLSAIVKTKSFELDSMTPAAAVEQMDQLEHDFFLFANEDSDRPAVVYRRDDGDIGLIEGIKS